MLQWYSVSIADMRKTEEKSFGIIPLRKKGEEWQVLLIKHQAGHWAFPKGHPEEGETARETATRELAEETKLKIVEIIADIPLQENYIFQREGSLVYKTVEYFPAIVKGDINIQEEELADFKWVNLLDAKTKITFPEGKNLCAEVEKRLIEEG